NILKSSMPSNPSEYYRRVPISPRSTNCVNIEVPQQSQTSGSVAGNIIPQTSHAQLKRAPNCKDVALTTLLASWTAASLSCSTNLVLVIIPGLLLAFLSPLSCFNCPNDERVPALSSTASRPQRGHGHPW